MLTVPTIETFTLAKTKSKTVTLTAYIAGTSPNIPTSLARRAVLIFPGGGYYFCSEREAEPVALAYLAAGFNTFVLDYSVTNKEGIGEKFPTQLIEAAMAMKFIRDNAEKFHIDPKYVFVNGYSAGGHLAASLGTLYNSEYVTSAIDMPENYARPTGMVLSYPVITSGKYAHKGSFVYLLHEDKNDPEKRLEVSLETRVTKDTVPAFIWHTMTDEGVNPASTLEYAKRLQELSINYELHIYPIGRHGLGLADKGDRLLPYIQGWAELLTKFLSLHNFI